MSAPNFPFREPIADRFPVNDRWRIWFRDAFVATSERAASRVADVALPAQSGSLATTPFPTGSLSAGLYRVSVFTRITTVAATSSSLAVTVSFTRGGVACSLSSPALTTNLTSSVQGTAWPIAIDAGTPISYSTTYASVPAGQMKYELIGAVETVNVP